MKLSRRKLADHTATRLLAGDDTAAALQELAAYLVNTRRTGELVLIVRDIEARLLAGGTALVTVTSARQLSAEATQAVEAYVKAQRPEVAQVVMHEEIDPSVIGGARVQFPGGLADFTIKAKLDKLTA